VRSGVLETTSLVSPLSSASSLNPKSKLKKRNIEAAVVLTSLIDAFSILVIYLLLNYGNSNEILFINKDMELPTSEQSAPFVKSTVVRVEKSQIFIEDKLVDEAQLVSSLVDIRKNINSKATDTEESFSLTIQADKSMTYKELNRVVLAGNHAGFDEIKFAVLMK
jgi:biopolymer transport protein ExbD